MTIQLSENIARESKFDRHSTVITKISGYFLVHSFVAYVDTPAKVREIVVHATNLDSPKTKL